MSLKTQKAACLREQGFTYTAIGQLLGVSEKRAKQLARLGPISPESDETVFPKALVAHTPIQVLPVSKGMRRALTELRIGTFADLQSADLAQLGTALLRYPNVGRKQVEELERLINSPNQTEYRPSLWKHLRF